MPPPGWPPPGYPAWPASRPSRAPLIAVLVVLAVIATLLGAGDGFLLAARDTTDAATYVSGDAGIRQLLDRRAHAITEHNESAFLADIDTSDSNWLARQRVEYANLVALGLSSFTLTLEPGAQYPASAVPASLTARFGGRVRVAGITIGYAVAGVDDTPVAAPWVPVFGYRDGHWMVAGEATSKDLPDGVGGLPWQAEPITVLHGKHVTLVVSTDDAKAGTSLLRKAETGVTRVDSMHMVDWSDRVLITAVTDASVFRAYFGDDDVNIDDTLAVTIPTPDAVPEWHRAHYVTSRVVLNPEVLGRSGELQHTLTHELAHAALGSVTGAHTPLWLVEGTAEYVAYATDVDRPTPADISATIHRVPKTLPTDDEFYGNAYNYLLGWQACVYLAKQYGQAKLFAFYRYFESSRDVDTGFSSVLGTTEDAFTSGWRSYMAHF